MAIYQKSNVSSNYCNLSKADFFVKSGFFFIKNWFLSKVDFFKSVLWLFLIKNGYFSKTERVGKLLWLSKLDFFCKKRIIFCKKWIIKKNGFLSQVDFFTIFDQKWLFFNKRTWNSRLITAICQKWYFLWIVDFL